METVQILLPLHHFNQHTETLVYGSSNACVWDWVQYEGALQLPCVLVEGPPRSGKSGFAKMLLKQNPAMLFLSEKESYAPPIVSEMPLGPIVIDDAHVYPHEWLFHLYNRQHQHRQHLTLFALENVSWETKDLRSRMAAAFRLSIHQPDDLMYKNLWVKLLGERGMTYAPIVLDYLLNHLERTYEGPWQLIQWFDQYTLSQHKKLTLPLVKEALNAWKNRASRIMDPILVEREKKRYDDGQMMFFNFPYVE